MFRFIAVTCDPHNEIQAQHARHIRNQIELTHQELSPVLSTRSVTVYCAGIQHGRWHSYALPYNQGVVLGTLFRDSERIQNLTLPEAAAIVASDGRALLSGFWGRYVAFLHDGHTDTTRVIRDPTGMLRCFRVELSGVQVLLSNIDDCLDLGLKFSLSHSWLRTYITSNINERLSNTALEEVDALHAGECFTIQRQHTRRDFYWSPFTFLQSEPITSEAEATKLVRHTLRKCVHGWASCHESIILRLSGGLDSSIVAACLADAPSKPSIVCFNHVSPGPDTDELRFAASVAEHAHLPLIEHPRQTHVQFEQLGNLRRHPYPMLYRYSLDYGDYESGLARELNATAIFSGEWGDALLYTPSERHPVLDYLQANGLDLGAFQVALDHARNEGRSVWSTLGHACKHRFLNRQTWNHIKVTLARYRTLLASEVIAEANTHTEHWHPWLKQGTAIPIGKRRHLYNSLLIDLAPIFDHFHRNRDVEHVSPIYSQPAIELFMRIPTYVLAGGGWNRATARRAFSRDLPSDVTYRRTKGGVSGYQKAVLLNNMDYAKALLLEGFLVQQKWLDKGRLEAALAWEPTRLNTILPELYFYLCIEAWIASWGGFSTPRWH